MMRGTVCTGIGPCWLRWESMASSKVESPPQPVPTNTPAGCGVEAVPRSASSAAWTAAATASCVGRSIWRSSRTEKWDSGLNAVSHPKPTGAPELVSESTLAAVDRPAVMVSKTWSLVAPAGVSIPTPVRATLVPPSPCRQVTTDHGRW